MTITLDGSSLTIEKLVAIAGDNEKIVNGIFFVIPLRRHLRRSNS